MNSVKDLTVALFNSDARFSEWRKDGQCTDLCAGACYYLPDKAWGSYSLMNNRSGYGSANTWYDHWNGQKGSEPKVGAIICWSVSDSGNTAGHVAVVSAVNDNGTINKLDAWNDNGKHCFNEEKNYVYKGKSNIQGFLYIPNYEEPQPTPTPTPAPTKSVDEVAREVIAGKWGNGEDRKNRLTQAGYNYSQVQTRVNEILVEERKKEEPYVPAIDDEVIINGSLYRSSDASSPSGTVTNRKTKITRFVKGAKHPYNTTGDLGWMDASSIKKA